MVWKECCIHGDTSGATKERAVKKILKPQKEARGLYYKRELEAIAKFSNPRASVSFHAVETNVY
jgi:hypothetical protein